MREVPRLRLDFHRCVCRCPLLAVAVGNVVEPTPYQFGCAGHRGRLRPGTVADDWRPPRTHCFRFLVCSQTVAIFISLNFTWPTELKQVFVSMSIINFNIQLLAPEVRLTARLVCGVWCRHDPIACSLTPVFIEVELHEQISHDRVHASDRVGVHDWRCHAHQVEEPHQVFRTKVFEEGLDTAQRSGRPLRPHVLVVLLFVLASG